MKQNRDTQIGERARATVAARAAADAAKRSRKNKTVSSDSSTGGSDTVPATSDRAEFLKELAKRNATPGMAKGGKMASYGMKKGGKATKFGAAMKKKSADTKGRAMVKKAMGGMNPMQGGQPMGGASIQRGQPMGGGRPMGGINRAKGGSIDGIAVKGKTKAKRVTMKNGGSC
jgi:hypothetical protein